MATLTRATLGKLTQRATKDIEIGDNVVRIQKPTPLEYSQYQMSMVDKDGKASLSKFADAIRLLVAKMWIDDGGNRIFADSELLALGSIDLDFYQKLSEECQQFAQGEASKTLGESDSTGDSSSPVESA
jgi:hypothetical protein